MRKNVASQTVGCQLISKTDGSNVTSGTTTVFITIDGGTQTTGGSAVHEGSGCWSYAPSAAETNGNHILYTFVNSSAITVSINLYPVSYDPTSATNLGLTNLDATITSRMASYTQPTGFLTTTFPSGTVASTTNITAATGVTVSTNNDKTGYSLTVSPPTAAQITTAIFTDLLAGSDFSTVGSFGKLVKDNLDTNVGSRMATYSQPTGFLSATFPSGTVASTTNITAGTITNLTSLSTDAISAASVSAAAVTKIQTGLSTITAADVWSSPTRLLTAGTNIVLAKGVGVTGFNDLSTTQVKTQVTDALNVDTYAETTAAPTSSATISRKLDLVYSALRNKVEVTASNKTFYTDSGAVKFTKALSDDGTTYSEAEGA